MKPQSSPPNPQIDMSRFAETACTLKKSLLSSVTPHRIKRLINTGSIDNRILTVYCQSKADASLKRDESYHALLYACVSLPIEMLGLNAVRYEWLENGKVAAWELPLHFVEREASVIELPVLQDFEILQELYNHASATGLPATCLRMDGSQPLFASDNVDRSCGVPKSDFLRLVSSEMYFPSDELAIYKDAIFKAQGASVELAYIAARVNDLQLCERRVAARLLKTSWGELVRLCKVLELPRPLGRTLSI